MPVKHQANFLQFPGFLKEGYTESLKRCVFPVCECTPCYLPQTEMVDYINYLIGVRTQITDFLRSDWVHLGRMLGIENYQAFQNCCENF